MFDATSIMRQTLNTGRLDQLTGAAFSPHQVNKAAAESGQVNGFNMQVMTDPMAELQDSMEELSFQFEEKEMKSIGERKIGEKLGPRSAYFAAVEGWQKVMPDMPGGAYMDRLLRQLRQMNSSGRAPDAQELFKMLQEGSKDPSHQFAMLDALEQALKDETALADVVRQAKKQLMATKGEEVRAGLNIAEEVNATATSLEEMQELRDLYRDEVLGFTSPQNCFRSLLSSRGPGGLQAGIDFLLKSCGLDLQSASPSQGLTELSRILEDLQCVNVLKTVLDKSTVLLGKMATLFGESCLLDGEGMTGKLMDFTERAFVSPDDIKAFIGQCGIATLPAQLYFCTDLINLFRAFSSRLFAEEGDRSKLVDAGQKHLDDLVGEQQPEDDEVLSGRRERP